MKPQIIDRFVYVKGKKISEVENTGTLHGEELIPIADNNQNFHTTVDLISEYVDNSHDYLTTGDYNDLKGQIDSERTNRQEADNELNQSIQDTKSELHSTISNVESELLNEVNDLQGLIDNINDTGIANGVTLDTVLTITGEKTFTTVPKSTASATSANDLTNKNYVDTAISEALGDTISDVVTTNTAQEISGLKTFKTLPKGDGTPTEDTDLVNKKYVDDAVANVDVDLDGYATEAWVNEQGFAKTSDIPEGLEIGETTGTAFDGGRGKAVEDKVGNLPQYVVTSDRSNPRFVFNKLGNGGLNFNYSYADLSTGDLFGDEVSIPTATVNNAGLISAADKLKLDSIPTLTTSGDGTKYLSDDGDYRALTKTDIGLGNVDNTSDLNKPISNATKEYIDEKIANKVVYANLTGLTLDAEEFESLKEDIESNSVFLCHIAGGTVQLCNEAKYIQTLNKLRFIFIYTEDNLVKTLTIEIDGNTYIVKSTVSESPDLSNYLTEDDKTELETEIGDLSENVNGQVTALLKKDSTIEGNVTNLTETVSTINETVSGLDNIYLRKTGGTISGNLQVDSSVKLRDNNDILDIKYSDPETLELEGKTFIRYNTSANGFIDIGTSGTSGPSSIVAYLAIRIKKAYNESDYKTGLIYINGSKAYQIFHENNISGSKVTTNDISGGLNITSITQSAYDGLDSKDANTLYIITE